MAWSSYGGDDVCQVTPKVLTCDLAPHRLDGSAASDLFVTVRTTGPGAISHRGVIASETDHNSADDSVTQDNWAGRAVDADADAVDDRRRQGCVCRV